MPNYNQHITEDRRLVILRLLSEDPGFSHNDRVLQTGLEHLGHVTSGDVIRGDIAWLADQGLVTVEIVRDDLHVAKLTSRGDDVAKGRTLVPGVKRPGPGS